MTHFDAHLRLKDDYLYGTLIYGWVTIDVYNGIQSVTYGNPLFHMYLIRTDNWQNSEWGHRDNIEFTLYNVVDGGLVAFSSFEKLFNFTFASDVMDSLVEHWASHETE